MYMINPERYKGEISEVGFLSGVVSLATEILEECLHKFGQYTTLMSDIYLLSDKTDFQENFQFVIKERLKRNVSELLNFN